MPLSFLLCPESSNEPGNGLITTFDSGDKYDKRNITPPRHFPNCVVFFCTIHAVSTKIYLSDGSTILASIASEVYVYSVRHIRGRKEEYA